MTLSLNWQAHEDSNPDLPGWNRTSFHWTMDLCSFLLQQERFKSEGGTCTPNLRLMRPALLLVELPRCSCSATWDHRELNPDLVVFSHACYPLHQSPVGESGRIQTRITAFVAPHPFQLDDGLATGGPDGSPEHPGGVRTQQQIGDRQGDLESPAGLPGERGSLDEDA